MHGSVRGGEGCELAKCVSACKCVQVLFFFFCLFAIRACLEMVASKQAQFYRGA